MEECALRMQNRCKWKRRCCMLSSGWFTGICSLNVNVSEHTVCSIFIGDDGTVFEKLAHEIKTPGNHPKEIIQQMKQTVSRNFGTKIRRRGITQKKEYNRWNSVSRNVGTKFRRRGITKKKEYNIQNMEKPWNQESKWQAGLGLHTFFIQNCTMSGYIPTDGHCISKGNCTRYPLDRNLCVLTYLDMNVRGRFNK
jgi:hypothetical protein